MGFRSGAVAWKIIIIIAPREATFSESKCIRN